MASKDARWRSRSVLRAVTISLAVALHSHSAKAQTNDPFGTNTAVYFYPPDSASDGSSSSYDYWWPYPPASTPSTMSDPTSTSSFPSDPASSEPTPLFPTMTFALNDTMTTASSSAPSSLTSPASSTSDTIIRITATSSPASQSQSSVIKFKIIYLTPLFAFLGLVCGITVSGMIYGRWSRRKSREVERASSRFTEADLLAHPFPYPRTGSTRLELGEGYGRVAEKEFDAGSDWSDEDEEQTHDTDHPNYRNRSPYETHAAARTNTLANDISPSSQYSKPTPSGDVSRPWYDRLPGLSTQLATSGPLRSFGTSKSMKTPYPDSYDPTSPSSDGNDDTAAQGIRSHTSIRRAIAERLRVGSRRVGGKKEGLTESSAEGALLGVDKEGWDGAAVRHASGSEIRQASGGELQRRARRASALSKAQMNQREYVEESSASEVVGLRLTPDENTRITDEGFEGGPDTPDSGPDPHRVLSNSSVLLPKSQKHPSSKLRAKSRPMSPSDADTDVSLLDPKHPPKSRFRRRSGPSDSTPQNNDVDPPSTLRLLNPPRRVISPPAHPELFFADPVLGNYIENDPSPLANRSRGQKHPASAAPRKLVRPPSKAISPSDGEGSRSAAEASTVSSAFERPMQPARTREMLGQVDAIMKTGWITREEVRYEESDERNKTKMQQLREAGLDARRLPASPSIAAARNVGIEERVRRLKEREDMS